MPKAGFRRAFWQHGSQNPRPTPQEKYETQARKIRDLSLLPPGVGLIASVSRPNVSYRGRLYNGRLVIDQRRR